MAATGQVTAINKKPSGDTCLMVALLRAGQAFQPEEPRFRLESLPYIPLELL
jgi:hypothetical protein